MPDVVDAPRDAPRERFPTAAQALGLVLAYFAVQTLVRTAVSGSADLDESEQLVLTQKLAWGYGSQPPLYTWLQCLAFGIFGVSIFALALLKNILLSGTYVFTYLNARIITGRHAAGLAAAAALLFIPQIAWESQRDLTHSVLASTCAGASLFCFLKLRERRSLARYLLFGLCGGLGLLSKYNYALLLAGLLIAALTIAELRPIVLDRRALLALVAIVLLVLPNALWILEHRDLAFQAAGKFHIEPSRGWLSSVGAGFGSVLKSTATFLGPLTLIFAILFRKRTAAAPAKSEYVQLLTRMLLVVYVALLFAVLVVGVSDIRERWLQPMLVCAPVLAVTLVRERLNASRLKIVLALAAVVMIGVIAAVPGRILLAERLQRTEPLNRPYPTLARQLRTRLGSAPLVVADTRLLAGNLRLNLPGWHIFVTPDLAALLADPRQPCVVVWDAMPRKAIVGPATDFVPAGPPEPLREFARQRGVENPDPSRMEFISATFQYHRQRQMWVGVLELP